MYWILVDCQPSIFSWLNFKVGVVGTCVLLYNSYKAEPIKILQTGVILVNSLFIN